MHYWYSCTGTHTLQISLFVCAYSPDKVNTPAALPLIAPHRFSKAANFPRQSLREPKQQCSARLLITLTWNRNYTHSGRVSDSCCSLLKPLEGSKIKWKAWGRRVQQNCNTWHSLVHVCSSPLESFLFFFFLHTWSKSQPGSCVQKMCCIHQTSLELILKEQPCFPAFTSH